MMRSIAVMHAYPRMPMYRIRPSDGSTCQNTVSNRLSIFREATAPHVDSNFWLCFEQKTGSLFEYRERYYLRRICTWLSFLLCKKIHCEEFERERS